MKDSTALILASLCLNILTIVAVISGLPIPASAVLSVSGLVLMGVGFAHLAEDK
jgi:hypothetical protein